MGRSSTLLTHGVDVGFWSQQAVLEKARASRANVVFWGVIDRRMDAGFVRQLALDLKEGNILLAGPEQESDPMLRKLPHTHHLGSVPFSQLPELARQSAVLVMPYADLPVTRAMQPLKLKEYLATGLPVVVRNLPANREWADCLDLVDTPEGFSAMVRLRQRTGLPESQRGARQRLSAESWDSKAARFADLILSSGRPLAKHA
jgi:glycosyltransferase involved in cell wall biosynthesis